MQCTALANCPEVWTDKEGFGVEGIGSHCMHSFFYFSSLSLHFPLSPLDLEVGIEYCHTILRSHRLVLTLHPLQQLINFRHCFLLPYDAARPVAGSNVCFIFSFFLLTLHIE